MKTSNKLLTALAIICIIVMIGIMTIIRSYASKPTEQLKGGDDQYTITHNEPILATQFVLGHNNRYYLDSEMEGIVISGSRYAVEAIEYINDSDLAFTYSNVLNAKQEKLDITIGTKDLALDKLLVNGNAYCESDRKPYPISDLEVQGNAHLYKFNIQSPVVSIILNGNSQASIHTDAEEVNADVNGNSKIRFKNESRINRLNVEVNGNAKLDAERVNTLTGSINGNAVLDVDNVMTEGNVSTSGNGRDMSNYRN